MRRALILVSLLLSATLLLTAAMPGPAQAKSRSKTPKDTPAGDVWSIVKAEDAYVLRYGPVRSPDPIFAAACQPAADLLQFTSEVTSDKIKSGDGVAVSMAVGRRKLELAATAFRGDQEGHLVVEAAVMLEARVLDLFEAGDTLIVSMPGVRKTLPLSGAKERLADFRRACLGQPRADR